MEKITSISFLVCFFQDKAEAQSIYPSTINVAGQYSAGQGNYQFELSLGESASIVTQSAGSLVVTSGVLQSFTSFASIYNAFPGFLPDEIKIYPNPFRDILEINLMHTNSGKIKIEIFDIQGKLVKEIVYYHFGLGRTERWDFSKLAQGAYIIVIQQLNGVGNSVVKKGTFKVLKIK
ncbi:T9SS type A sorting domain-containing protein [Sediminibacterium salmoneum]|uniref:T9SS type A sorting domain-containing protein n=1 Tax=Sediminibacterium salmoneum TaxID=426421 RepID=UPI000A0360BD|nr:T9SS type A sorting domain-containing protein [Sediminibacterium salmoneum]